MITFQKSNSKVTIAARVMLVCMASVSSMQASSAEPILEAPVSGLWSNVYFIILLTVSAVLFVCILTLSAAIKNIASTLKSTAGNTSKIALLVLGLLALNSSTLLAGNAEQAIAIPVNIYGGLSAPVFYSMLAFIVFLGVILIVQLSIIRKLLSKELPGPVITKQIPSLPAHIFRYGIGFCLLFLFVACCYFERTTMRTETEKNYQAQLKEAAGPSYGIKLNI
jgi:hypothetical protein